MNREDIIKLAQKANEGFLDKQGTMDLAACLVGTDAVMHFAAAIRSATKEEDAGICRHLTQPSLQKSLQNRSIQDAWANGTLDCESAIRASK